MRLTRQLALFVPLALSLVVFPGRSNASLLIGTLNTTGVVNVSLAKIVFGAPTGTNGPLFVNADPAPGVPAQTGGWESIEGTQAVIQNFNEAVEPVGVPLNIPNFITFAAAPNISITLTLLIPGIDGAAGCSAAPPMAGQVCTPNVPAQSPYNLQNTSATSSTASLRILGTEVDSSTGMTTPVTGTFSQPISDMNYQQILATVNGGGTFTTTFAAQFTTVPEPANFIPIASGMLLLGIGTLARRRRQRQ